MNRTRRRNTKRIRNKRTKITQKMSRKKSLNGIKGNL